ncbi:YncE family protein [Sphingobacterium kitahiroshimense]|uniref:YncE family protein n=1 Tax=Sphingobacterium kitahiroshimense TaxID=470446 RepID=A0ABV0BVQ7_9SPHI
MKKNVVNRKQRITIPSLLMMMLAFSSCGEDKQNLPDRPELFEEKIVIANRNSGSLSFIDAIDNSVTKTLKLPDSEPMYVVYVPKTDRLYVGDRATKKIHVINPANQEIETSINVGAGIFHMWADGQGKELWVVNDMDNSISVINLQTNAVTTTIAIDAKPHDIFITKDGSTAYVSIFTTDRDMDKVYKYATSSYSKTAEINVGKEPHLYAFGEDKLYVPCQSGQLYTLDATSLEIISQKQYEGAHGITGSARKNALFVSNITGGQLYSIDPVTSDPFHEPVTTDNTPHNMVLNDEGDKMFVTHSGASANLVSIYSINAAQAISYSTSVTVENNPFGLTYYKRNINK